MNIQSPGNIVFALLILMLGGCSGGTGGTGASPTGSTPVVSSGVMTKGSVIVNGVRFEDTLANISIDDTPKTPADLKDGMVVKVRGRLNDDRISGTADRLEVENEVRGVVQGKNPSALPPSFTVVGQTVLVDDLTVFANFASPPATPSAAVNALTASTSIVEVHGQRDVNGNIRASRLELLASNPLGDELRGTISGLTPSTFNLGSISVSYTPATTILPAGTLANGILVEVHGNFNGAVFNAARIDLEDAEDSSLAPTANDEVEIEGFVASFTSTPGSFTVAGRSVQTTSSTRFENGVAADLANNVKVEAEGRLSGSTLVAQKISFRRAAIRIIGLASAVNVGNRTVTVFGKTIQVDDVTELRTQTAGGTQTSTLNDIVANTDRVEVRGYLVGSTVIADRLEDHNTNSGSGNRDVLQALVEAENETTFTLTLLGITANLGGTVQFFDQNNAPITRAQFFTAVTAPVVGPPARPGTLVKVKGTYNGANSFAGEEAELEN